MVKRARERHRGIPNGVQKHKIRLGNTDPKAKSNFISLLLTKNKHRLEYTVSVCWKHALQYSSSWFLVPFEQKKLSGILQQAPHRKQILHYIIVMLYSVTLIYKLFATSNSIALHGLGLVAYLCALSLNAISIASSSAIGSTWLAEQMCHVINSWESLLCSLEDFTGRRRTLLVNPEVNLKVTIAFVSCILLGANTASFSLIDNFPVGVLPALTNVGLIDPSWQSNVLWRMAFFPVELLMVVPPLIVTGLCVMTAMLGLAVFRMYVDEMRLLSIEDMKGWEKCYKMYRILQVYNGVFMAWLKLAIAPVLFSSSCGVTLLLLIALRPSGLHPFIYVFFPIISGIVLVDITLFCYECVIIKRSGEEVLHKLQSKMTLRRLQLLDVEKQRCVRMMSKSLRGVYLAVGDFSEMTLNVPVNILEEILNQLLFLLSL